MNFSCFAETAANLCICMGAIVAIWQLRLMRENFRLDHERRKKQATFEFYSKIRVEYDESLKQIDAAFPESQVINVKDVKDDPDMLSVIRKYLYNIEMLSVGINTGIYDVHVFERMSGVYTTKWYERLKEIIEYFRKNTPNHIAYKDFENLVSKLKEIRKKRFPEQDYDFAKMKCEFE